MYLDKPLFELPSSADGAQMPATRMFSAWPREASGKPLARGKKPKPRCLGDVESSAFRNIFLSRFSFCSLLKTNIHQKGKKKGFERK